MEEERKMNKMGVEPISKLLLGMGLPMMASMVLQALYNVVDSYFVSQMRDTAQITGMGELGVNALTLAFPVQMFMVAIGVGTGVGINALLAKSLGEGNRKKASAVAGNAIFLGIITFLVFFLFGIFGVDAYLATQTSDEIIFQMAKEYLVICSVFSFGIVLYTIYEKILQATGRTVFTTISQISGAVVNMILDPIFIFGYFGVPQMGIKGAAYATVIGQIVSFILDMTFHYRFNHDVDRNLFYLKPNWQIIKEIYIIGLPAIVMQALMSFMTYGVNIILAAVSTAAVTAYGVYYKIQQFVFFAAFGMNNALIPVMSFNFGKGDKKRVEETKRYGMLYILVIMAAGMILLQGFAANFIMVFSVSGETQRLCIMAIRIITLGYFFAGANIAYQGIFQALGLGVSSLLLSLLRQIVLVLPLAYLFTRISGNSFLMWAAFPLAELGAFFYGFFMMRKKEKKLQQFQDS